MVNTAVPKYVGVIIEYTILYVGPDFIWFIKGNKLIKMHGVRISIYNTWFAG